MPNYLTKEEIRQWRSSLEKITLEEFAARLGKTVEESKPTNDVVDIVMSKGTSSNTNTDVSESFSAIAERAFKRERQISHTPFSITKKDLQENAAKAELASKNNEDSLRALVGKTLSDNAPKAFDKESLLDNCSTLSSFINNNLKLLGLNSIDDFPILIKIIDAKEDLSIQVHPDNEYAKKMGYKNGKYECWYILDKTKNNLLIKGFKNISKDEFKNAILTNTLENYLNYVSIKPYDLIEIYPGTVHAILKNTFLLEVQDPCDITYRLYDYNRLPKRELHIDDALNVIYKDKKENYKNKFEIINSNISYFVKIVGFERFFFEINKFSYDTYLIIND